MGCVMMFWAAALLGGCGLVDASRELKSLAELGVDDGAREGVSMELEVTSDADAVLELPTGAKLTVPAGAVDGSVTLSLARPKDAEALQLVKSVPSTDKVSSAPYVFKPHGIQFKKEVEVTLPVAKDRDSEKLVVAWLRDEKDTQWKTLGKPRVKDGLASIALEHFSVLVLLERSDLAGGGSGLPGDEGEPGDGDASAEQGDDGPFPVRIALDERNNRLLAPFWGALVGIDLTTGESTVLASIPYEYETNIVSDTDLQRVYYPVSRGLGVFDLVTGEHHFVEARLSDQIEKVAGGHGQERFFMASTDPAAFKGGSCSGSDCWALIQEYDRSTQELTTIASKTTGSGEILSTIGAMAFDGENNALFVLDSTHASLRNYGRLTRIDLETLERTVVTDTIGETPGYGAFLRPAGLALSAAGDRAFVSGEHRSGGIDDILWEVDLTSGAHTSLSNNVSHDGPPIVPEDVVVDAAGRNAYVVGMDESSGDYGFYHIDLTTGQRRLLAE